MPVCRATLAALLLKPILFAHKSDTFLRNTAPAELLSIHDQDFQVSASFLMKSRQSRRRIEKCVNRIASMAIWSKAVAQDQKKLQSDCH